MYEISKTAPVFPSANVPARCAPQAHESGALRVDESYSYCANVTPSATPFAQPCDAVVTSDSATVVGVMADGGTLSIAMYPGLIYPIRFASMTSVSAGTATILYHRKLA